MAMIETTVECVVHDSFRVRQVAGLFDVPLEEKAKASFAVEVPGVDEDWQIGLIVGPSGSGKSTIARAAFGEALVTHFNWPRDKAVIDCFPAEPGIKAITGLLTAVGFSSPPSWVKPYEVLSGGEKFRCDLARGLASVRRAGGVNPRSGPDNATRAGCERQPPDYSGGSPEEVRLIAFDEFTSVVDRTVARIGSAAVAKAIRGGLAPCRFVAVSCHYDIAEWLSPDWVVDMATLDCTRRCLRRPAIQLRIHRATAAAWRLFARHHYLSGQLNRSARCYVAWWNEEPVAFCATLPVWGRKDHDRISRMVVLPDYQGIGIGMRVAEAVAEVHVAAGSRFNITASHPAVIAHCRRSEKWRVVNVSKYGWKQSRGRAVASFEYACRAIVAGERVKGAET